MSSGRPRDHYTRSAPLARHLVSFVVVQRPVSPLAFREVVYNQTNQIDIGVERGMKVLHSHYIWLDDLGTAIPR